MRRDVLSTVPVPNRMLRLSRDRRGYPVPWIVQRDLTRRPFFTMNDAERVVACGRRKVCGICGQKLERDVWLIGGPGAAFHEYGAYLDPPMHRACATYALRVCPYLGTRYTGRVDEALLKFGKWPPNMRLLVEDHMIPEQPPFFVLARTTGAVLRWNVEAGDAPRFHPKRPWLAVEFWHHGARLDEVEARERLAGNERWPWTPGDLVHWQAPEPV